MKKALLIFLIFNAVLCQAQELIPIGEWRTHFNYQKTNLVEIVNQKIFTSTPNSIMVLNLESEELTSLTRIDDLSEIGISAMAFDDSNQRLVLGYENGNLDMITGSDVHNNPVLLKSDIVDDKTIRDISFYENTLNLSTEFGVLVLDVNTDEVTESYRNLGEDGEKIAVMNSVFQDDFMYLASSEGVLRGDRGSGDNLQDFNNWERFDGSLVHNQEVISVAVMDQIVFAALSNSLVELSGQNWAATSDFLAPEETIRKLKPGVNGLLILTNQGAYQMESGLISQIQAPTNLLTNDLVEFTQDEFYLASENDGLVKLADAQVEKYSISGPYRMIDNLEFESEVIYGFPALDRQINAPVSNEIGISQFESGNWTNTALKENFDNISSLALIDEKQYFGSFGQGVLDISTGMIFDESNSTLQEHSFDVGNILVSGLDADQNGNLWVSTMAPYPLHRMESGESWQRMRFGVSASEEPTDLKIHADGSIWMPLGLNAGTGVLAYDPDLEVNRHITSSNTSLPSNRVNDIAFDRDNEIWFATDKGVAYFPFSNGVIGDPSIDVVRPVFDNAYLFENKKVTSIAVDAGNRKWMGTREGVWLLEDSGNELIHHFDIVNSPLPSNNILDLSINHDTGEIFISTDRGVISFRNDATRGSTIHQNVKIFPNPVNPDFTGLVGFDGLARDANLKITTVSGRLVREIHAAGSGASWDVSDYNGHRVSTGVYLVFSSNEDGSETFVGKIAVIN